MATKRDIALLAGVSPATVSNFYNSRGKMSIDTQQRIIDAANTLNFPLPAPKEHSKITFLVVDDLLNPHYYNILQGMNSIACKYNIPVSMILLWDDVDAFCSMLIANQVHAVYFATFMHRINESHINLLRSNGICVHFSWDNFTIDFDSLMNQAIRYLADLGHKRISYLSGLSINDTSNTRYHSYLKAMEENHLPLDRELIIDGIFPYFTDAKSGYWALKTFLDKKIDFTAIISLNDLLAIGAMNALKESGLSIPQDVSVIGCDDIMLAEFMNPPLTTLRFSAKDIGIRTMYSIIQQDEKRANNSPVILQTELIIRKSTGKAPKTENEKPL